MRALIESRISTLRSRLGVVRPGLERERLKGHLAEAVLILRLVELGEEEAGGVLNEEVAVGIV